MEPNGTNQTKHFKVVVGIDFSNASGPALQRAFDMANREVAGEVHAVSVVQYARHALGVDAPPAATVPPDAVPQLEKLVTDALADFAKASGRLNLRRVVSHVLSGSPAQEIVWLAAHLDADAIVVGTHGRRGASRLLLGSVAETVVRKAGCPVLVERPKHHNEAWREPVIEPPCPDCMKTRTETRGAEQWCARHVEHHLRKHLYSYDDLSGQAFRPWGFSS